MHTNNAGDNIAPLKKPLIYVIEDKSFETVNQYITGAELKNQAGIPLDINLYLKIKSPYEDELIDNDKQVNLARPNIEKFFVKDVYFFKINNSKISSYKRILSGTEILNMANIDDKCVLLYQKVKGNDYKVIELSDNVDLSEEGIEHFITKESNTFTYTVNGEHEMTDKKVLTPNQILDFAGIDKNNNYLIQLFEDGSKQVYAYNPEESIHMVCNGLIFITAEWLEIVDIEQYGNECKEIPPAKSFRIKIDKAYHIVNDRYISQEMLISLGGKPNVALYDVYKFLNGNPKPIKINQGTNVDLTEKCLVRFVLQPKEQQDGKGNRQEFTLPEEDLETLEKMGLQWETLSLKTMWLFIYDYPIPSGYNVKTATLALMITSSYPLTEIDMAHFSPPLVKNQGRINATANHLIDGKTFQQWSRHRKPGQWVQGVDNLATHLSLVDNWLINDLKR